MNITTVSIFIFVNLFWNERMEKPLVERERSREGIEINKGLLALGMLWLIAKDLQRGERCTLHISKQSHLAYYKIH